MSGTFLTNFLHASRSPTALWVWDSSINLPILSKFKTLSALSSHRTHNSSSRYSFDNVKRDIISTALLSE